MNAILISALSIHVTTVGAALAGGKLDVANAEWQPRQAVLSNLDADQGRYVRSRPMPGASDSIEWNGRSFEMAAAVAAAPVDQDSESPARPRDGMSWFDALLCQVFCDAAHFVRATSDQGSGGLVPRRFHAARETCSQGLSKHPFLRSSPVLEIMPNGDKKL
ncbi:hypothetical protein [Mesorhizobium sp. WSM2239]|uniref:Uncharacterized protein n=2 Tax=unclassified Mesorhizobium TaxID=325217 RepID=A0AAU8D8W5_9HYPH